MAKVLEYIIVKLLGVVNGDFSQDVVAVDDALPQKFHDSRGAYVCDGLLIDQLCKIFNHYNSECVVALGWS
jgi:hypothetical protein